MGTVCVCVCDECVVIESVGVRAMGECVVVVCVWCGE